MRFTFFAAILSLVFSFGTLSAGQKKGHTKKKKITLVQKKAKKPSKKKGSKKQKISGKKHVA